MLCVKTKLLPSKIHGLGLFADEFIPKRTLIWKFTPGFDQRFTKEQLLKFPKTLQIYFYKYSSKSRKSSLYLLCADYGNFINHSENPTCRSVYEDNSEETVIYAARDINIGEEITENYNAFENLNDKDNVLNLFARKYKLNDELDPRLKIRKQK